MLRTPRPMGQGVDQQTGVGELVSDGHDQR